MAKQPDVEHVAVRLKTIPELVREIGFAGVVTAIVTELIFKFPIPLLLIAQQKGTIENCMPGVAYESAMILLAAAIFGAILAGFTNREHVMAHVRNHQAQQS